MRYRRTDTIASLNEGVVVIFSECALKLTEFIEDADDGINPIASLKKCAAADFLLHSQDLVSVVNIKWTCCSIWSHIENVRQSMRA